MPEKLRELRKSLKRTAVRGKAERLADGCAYAETTIGKLALAAATHRFS